ncbi:Trp53 inducible protein 5, isoform CRA_a [Mus musculus]|nr:Trp53 inducible protein 5, isoform CRA_a [Mus musculus]
MQDDESSQIFMGPEGDQLPLVEMGSCKPEASDQWDCVLVADLQTLKIQKHAQKQLQFLENLESNGFHFKMLKDQKKVFFGIRADSDVIDKYRTLLMNPEDSGSRDEQSFNIATTRIRIVSFVVNNKLKPGDTFEDLVKDGVFETMFLLHKGEQNLKNIWARWRNMFEPQPIDEIREYFGEKVALYFTWLGWYTYMLVPAAVVGLIVFLSGFALFDSSQISKEICSANDIFMCPLGDHSHRYLRLSEMCTFAKLTHLFDNEGTVLFAIFMALWATVFLEIWKRKRAHEVQSWKLYEWDEEEEEMALELINSPHYKLKDHRHSYLSSTIILILSLFMICLMIGMAHVLVVYRVLAGALFSSLVKQQVTTAVVVTGAVVHYIIIVIMTKTRWPCLIPEESGTFSEQERKFTVKFFILQFFAHFSSLIYIAFILGRINGHPGKSTRLAGLWKLEECHLSGCMMDLFIQMAIIMGLKQTLSNCVEYLCPLLAHKWRLMWASKHGHMSKDPELKEWQRNYYMNPINTFSLFDEFMEMMIQYGFTTIFVAAFPLAPLLALFSNLVEIRLDAIKMVRLQRRLVPRKAKDIGTWLQVLETIGVLAVIANGMVIAFTSEFIPRVVYKYHYGPCRTNRTFTDDCLTNYVNHSLSVFYTKHFNDHSRMEGQENVTVCRYRDYRNEHDYNLSEQFWFILAIRLTFVILFEHFALCIKLIAAWFVPDVPQKVKNEVLQEKYDRIRHRMRFSSRSTDV